MLLPLPCNVADDLSLRYHIALEAMRTGCGYPGAVHALTAVMLLTQFLAGAGYGRISAETQSGCEKALTEAFDAGDEGGRWKFDEADYVHVQAVVNLHDIQLRTTPMARIVAAGEQLDRLKAIGGSRSSQAQRAENRCDS